MADLNELEMYLRRVIELPNSVWESASPYERDERDEQGEQDSLYCMSCELGVKRLMVTCIRVVFLFVLACGLAGALRDLKPLSLPLPYEWQ
jgi:hypothetical protein